MDELGKKRTLYDTDILVRMYYRIILLCKFTIIPNSTICSKSRLYNFRISKMPNLVSVKSNPSMKLLETPNRRSPGSNLVPTRRKYCYTPVAP